jgi:glycosyltransferase involved in cell wall biosynthesis
LFEKLTIIIPVYNEASTINELLHKVESISLINKLKKQLIIINDFSVDKSREEIEKFIDSSKNKNDIVFIDHKKNLGKGGAIKSAILKAEGDYSVIQDADLELNPNEINNLLEPILNNQADIVYGSRFINNKKQKKESILNRIANVFLTSLGNIVFGVKLTDMQTCYKMIPTKVFKSLNLKENRFAFDPEITAKLSKIKNLKWKEVAISYNPRTKDEGKKIRWKDGFRALYCIIKYGLFK